MIVLPIVNIPCRPSPPPGGVDVDGLGRRQIIPLVKID
jgi:hypothetical protein